MPARLAILTFGVLLVATGAGAQQSAGAAMREILFRGEWRKAPSPRTPKPCCTALFLGETTTFPTGTSAGGFTWTFDDTLHVPVRRSRSFGPMFAERPFTTGKGKLNVGAAFQHTTFSSVGGRPLTDLEKSATYVSGDVNRYTVVSRRPTRSDDCERHLRAAQQSRRRGDCALRQRPCLWVRLLLPGVKAASRRVAHRRQRLVVRHRRHPASNEGCSHRERQLRRRCSGGHPPANG